MIALHYQMDAATFKRLVKAVSYAANPKGWPTVGRLIQVRIFADGISLVTTSSYTAARATSGPRTALLGETVVEIAPLLREVRSWGTVDARLSIGVEDERLVLALDETKEARFPKSTLGFPNVDEVAFSGKHATLGNGRSQSVWNTTFTRNAFAACETMAPSTPTIMTFTEGTSMLLRPLWPSKSADETFIFLVMPRTDSIPEE